MHVETRQFRGDRTGFSGWRAQVATGRGIATPAVAGDHVIFGGGFGSHDVYSLDAATGRLRWHEHTRDDGPTAAVVVGDTVLFNTESCTLTAVEAATGALRWEKWLGDPLLAQPAAVGDRVLMVYPGGGKHWLAAFDVHTGRELWRTPLGHDVITAPILADGKAYVATYDGMVSCFVLESGEPCWSKDMGATSAPWVADGKVYVAQRSAAPPESQSAPERHGGVPQTDQSAVERTMWCDRNDGMELGAYSAKSARYLHREWGSARKAAYYAEDAAVGFGHAPASAKMHLVSALIGEGHVSRAFRFQGSRPVVQNGVVFDTTGDRLEAREAATDRVLWSWADARAEEGERRLTPPAVANGRVLVGTWDGYVISLDASSGHLRWRVPVGAPCHWQPVMAQGRVFAGLEDGSVVAFETGDIADDGWSMWGGGPGHNGAFDELPGASGNTALAAA